MPKTPLILATAVLAMTGAAMTTTAQAREQIRIVGSSTVFPFATAVAEQFGKTTKFKTPVVESTGSGGGLKLFCAGVGVKHPDITNSSRRIKKSEVENCAKNGVKSITEVKLGFDGIVIANSKKVTRTNLTLRQVFLALAKKVPADDTGATLIDNPYKKWSDIDPSLPNTKIEVLGPPPTSGTRDAFVELAMEGGCKTFPAVKALAKSQKKKYAAVCHGIREDGAFVEAGENDNLIVQKLDANPQAYGIFGYSFLDQNADSVQGVIVNNVTPTFENISAGKYKISRSLYFYVKNAHVGVIPGMRDYVSAFTSETAFGPEGYLADKGLIPLADSDREIIRESSRSFAPLSR
ncbi:MAG: substrate-binding domain-containing protein [Proteobacteria bacterium]|nr:substrate-binding domain-containing protein [Pseudomonadota bacterium]